MDNLLRSRIQSRLDALNLNPFEAARRIPAERAFLNDLLIGKKGSIRANAIPRVAGALECDPGYLMGTQDTPRLSAPRESAQEAAGDSLPRLPLAGIAEAGAWRPAPASGPPQALPVSPDPRYPAESQIAVLIRGDHAEWLGAGDGAVVVAVKGGGYRDGDAVLIRRARPGEDGQEAEVTLRRVDAGKAVLSTGASVDLSSPSVEVIARAVSSHITM